MLRLKSILVGKRVLVGILLCLLLGLPIHAQDDENTVNFTGVLSEISDDALIVGGVVIDIQGAVLPASGLTTGITVQVIGIPDGQQIRATVIVIVNTNPMVVTATPTPLPAEATADITPTETTSNAVTPTPTISPVIINNAPIIVIEGAVESININSITIFDIDIQVEPSDPILTEIRIGDIVRIEGQSSLENNIIVIVAVNITIIETTVIIINEPGVVYVPVGLPSNCKRTKKGKVTCKNSRGSRRT